MRIGVCGCGAIGSEVCYAVDKGKIKGELSGLCDIVKEKAENLLKNLSCKPPVLNLDELISVSDLVVEAAHKDSSAEIARKSILGGKEVLIMSVGGLVDNPDVFDLAREKGVNVYIPSGAIGGLDALKSVRNQKIKSVTLTTTKPPRGLSGVSYLKERNIDVEKLKEKTVIFEGTAREACKAFPVNVNVAASLSFSGIGVDNTRVRVVVDPKATRNVHAIEVEGDFGKFNSRTENVPSPNNPKTSYLAALACVECLRDITDPVKIGT